MVTLQRIKETFAQSGLTQEELALKAGIAQEHISRLFSGTVKHPRKSTLGLLANALHIAEDSPVYGLKKPMPSYGLPREGTIGDLIKGQELIWEELRGIRACLEELKRAWTASGKPYS